MTTDNIIIVVFFVIIGILTVYLSGIGRKDPLAGKKKGTKEDKK